jgi:hypothetical protein
MKILNNYLVTFFIMCVLVSLSSEAMEDHDCAQCRGSLGPSIHGSTGKWLDQNVPHRNWECLEVEDLGYAAQKCEMCESETIRYVHRMKHDECKDHFNVGCICAGHMEGDSEEAQLRDKKLKSRAQRRDKWLSLSWKDSKKGNPYLKTRANKSDAENHVITIIKGKYNDRTIFFLLRQMVVYVKIFFTYSET